MSLSFKDYLDSLSESEENRNFGNLYDDCEDDCEDEVNESAQIQLDLLKQIQPKLANAPLNVLKQVLKKLENASDE